MHLLRRDPRQSILLLSADREIGGRHLEPVVASSLSPAARELVDPLVVADWPGYLVSRSGSVSEVPDPVLLLDPVQLTLELQSVLEPQDLPTDVRRVTRDGAVLSWDGGGAKVGELVDLERLTRRENGDEVLGLAAARSLALPVLADFDTHGEPWDALQHLPLGDERVYIRKRRCEGDAEQDLTVRFGRLLSDMIAF